ncbi:MAG: hypothetical protein C0613_08265 [Desulfobulbaceae bacterium]|nr:MAG: hypothetical protein C0613_08265 [Desulfobulbaceae bacterium]
MGIFNLYHDSGLTNPVEAGDPLVTEHNADGSTGAVDVQLFFGSDDDTKNAEADSNPGVDQIELSIVDGDGANGHEPTVMALALSQAGLDAAVPGAPVDLGTSVAGGVAAAIPVWVRVTEGVQEVANWADLSLQTNQLKITAV